MHACINCSAAMLARQTDSRDVDVQMLTRRAQVVEYVLYHTASSKVRSLMADAS